MTYMDQVFCPQSEVDSSKQSEKVELPLMLSCFILVKLHEKLALFFVATLLN